MCGIAGIFQIDKPLPKADSQIKSMVGQLFHRGPDECGFYFDRNIAMGMSRLSIIDLSQGSQPLSNEDKSIWIVFNGEIYNYPELRNTLVQYGHRFKTQSDTEVIVHCYEQWDLDFVNYLNGQFAISIWDRNKNQLLLVRDRLGIRPLFYTILNHKVIFASEIKAILAEGSVKAEPDFTSLNDNFTFWCTLPPKTMFKQIYELPPGHMLIASPKEIKTIEYWDIPYEKAIDESDNQKEIEDQLFALLKDAVKIRLRADVPVGAYLSGGLDSSIITSLIKNLHQNRLKTFSVNFEQQSYDEAFYQKLLISQLKTDHHSLLVGDKEIFKHFFNVVWFAEKPVLRTAPAPLLALSDVVRKENFKVVLTGEGADEFFAGYNIFKENRVRRFWSKCPDSKVRPLLLSRIYPYILTQQNSLNPFWQAFFKRHLTETENPFYSHLLRWENTAKIHFLLEDSKKSNFKLEQRLEELQELMPKVERIRSPLAKAQYIEAKLFLNGYLLSSQGDRMLMGHSVEGRFPFLDHRVVEFSTKIPEDLKLNGLNEKYILKKTFGPILPEAIARRPKQPYRAPVSPKIFDNRHFEWIEELLSPQKIKSYGYFNVQRSALLKKKIKNSNQAISMIDEMAFNAILSTQLWHFHFIENFSTKNGKLPNKQKIVDQRKE